MRQDCIHETVLRDIIELINDFKDTDAIEMYMKRNKSIKSINSQAAGLVLVYPTITSNSLPIQVAQMITKAIERKAVSLLRLIFAANARVNSATVNDYLKQYHVNLSLDSDLSVESILDTIDKYVVKESVMTESKAYLDMKGAELLVADLKNQGYLRDSISETSLSEYTISKVYGETNVIKEAPTAVSTNDIAVANKRNELNTKNLLDNDVKKSNELVETQLMVNLYGLDAAGNNVPVSFIVGVKAKMYPLDSMDIVERINNKNKDSNFFMKLVRTTTREISFFKDFLFAVERAKTDAMSVSMKSKSSSTLWKVLERRGSKSKLKRLAGMKNNAMAITTLVVSQSEVEFLKKEYNTDIEDPKVIRPIMEAYNLMGFVIVDEASEVAKFIFDTGEDLYEHLSFNALERESSDNSYKRIVNLIAKGGSM